MPPTGRTLLAWILFTSTTVFGTSAFAQPAEHVVQPDQTLAKIAKRYRISVDELCEANDINRHTVLKPGQKLVLPDDDDVDSTPSKSRRADNNDRAKPLPGRGSGTAQKVDRHGSYARYLKAPTKRGYVHLVGHHGEYKGQLVGKSGKLQPKAVIAVSKLLAWPRTDFVMDKRLLLLLAKVSDAFGGRMLRVVSGYRTTSYSSESRHPMGRACDFLIPGVPNAVLRDYARTFKDVGVGYYPNSTFIHFDVRDYDAYWVDYAGPGEAPRYRVDHGAKIAKLEDTEEDGSSTKSAHDESPKPDEARAKLDAPIVPPRNRVERSALLEAIRSSSSQERAASTTDSAAAAVTKSGSSEAQPETRQGTDANEAAQKSDNGAETL